VRVSLESLLLKYVRKIKTFCFTFSFSTIDEVLGNPCHRSFLVYGQKDGTSFGPIGMRQGHSFNFDSLRVRLWTVSI